MKEIFLEFEKPIEELNKKIVDLNTIQNNSSCDISAEIEKIQLKVEKLKKQIYSNLTPFEISKMSRHPQRPYTLDYIQGLFNDFEELHGDRTFADDKAIVGGIAKFEGWNVMVIGHQKGRDTKQKILRNFGMSKPEGYRKALRLMKLAEKFNMPILTFVDTPGAYPGIGAEERGQSQAIGLNLYELAKLKVPVISTIIGEGGSGGALAIAVGDYINMLEFATYSVISPEGCASILWKTTEKASEAANALGITSSKLLKLNLIDCIIKEPLGGAHRDYNQMFKTLKNTFKVQLKALTTSPLAIILEKRFDKILAYGKYNEK